MKTFRNGSKLPERNYETEQILFCKTTFETPINNGEWIECDEEEIKKANAVKLFEIPTLEKYFGWL